MGNNGTDIISTRIKPLKRCRICGSSELHTYLDLGYKPLANNLAKTQHEALHKEKFPLKVCFCGRCGLSQLTDVVDPRILFSDYCYRSSISKTFIQHCRDMAKEFKDKYKLIPHNSMVVDIAGNDGTLLEQFIQEIPGLRVLNIDPAKNLAPISKAKGVPVETDFFNTTSACMLLAGGYYKAGERDTQGLADVVTATNVFAHVDNVREFIHAAKLILRLNGVLVLEFPYLVDYVDYLEYDTTYHEHLSYMSIRPLNLLCEETGMKIIDVEKKEVHGGTVRVTIAHAESWREPTIEVEKHINYEVGMGFDSLNKYIQFGDRVVKHRSDIAKMILRLKNEGHRIGGFAASAKGNTLLNASEINHTHLDYIIDDTPEKQGKFSPGTGIPILSIDALKENPVDYLIILSWNFHEEIINRLSDVYHGKFIIPIPNLKVQYGSSV